MLSPPPPKPNIFSELSLSLSIIKAINPKFDKIGLLTNSELPILVDSSLLIITLAEMNYDIENY